MITSFAFSNCTGVGSGGDEQPARMEINKNTNFFIMFSFMPLY
ncbi:hypothetical protein ECMP0215613_5065 [Escherichia coli MP021561.3]|nr:hypothetical protein ECMP0215613_5065 [Escherichia coli MP021561.3]